MENANKFTDKKTGEPEEKYNAGTVRKKSKIKHKSPRV